MDCKKIWLLLFTIVMMLFLFACAPGEAPSSQQISAGQIPGGKERATNKEAWEVKWEKTIQEARKEGNVVRSLIQRAGMGKSYIGETKSAQ